MDLKEVIKKRASIKKYSDKKPKIEDVVKAVETANLAPSPGNLPILRYLIIEDVNKIEKIAEACQQDFLKEVKILVVFLSESKDAEIMYDKRAKKYIKQHVGAAAENFLLSLTDMGLVSCWVGAWSDITLRNILVIPDNVEIEAIFPVGYQMKIDKRKQKIKPRIESRLYFETWKNKYRKPFEVIRD